MDDDCHLRKADRLLWHLSQLEKTYKVEKHKDARDLLLKQALEGGADTMQAVQKFKNDPRILAHFTKEAEAIRRGHASRPRYNTCLGLLTGRLVYW